MAGSISDMFTALQNAVVGINNAVIQLTAISDTLGNVFPQTTALSATTPSSVGALSFSSSQPATFFTVTTSSGGTYKLAAYPST